MIGEFEADGKAKNTHDNKIIEEPQCKKATELENSKN